MKKISGFKLGLGIVAAAFFAFAPYNAFATVKLGGKDISKGTVTGATFDGVSTITLDNYSGSTKTLDIDEASPVTIILKGTNKVKGINSKNNVNFSASTGSLSLTSGISFSGNGIIVLDSSICASSKLSSTKQGFASTNVTISSENCKKGAAGEENPDTFDMIYVYAAVLLASSAILGYRRYLAKH